MSSDEPKKPSYQMRPLTLREQQVHEDLWWAMTNSDLNQQYEGQIVAVWNKQVVACAATEEDLTREVERTGRSIDEVAIVECPPPFMDIPH